MSCGCIRNTRAASTAVPDPSMMFFRAPHDTRLVAGHPVCLAVHPRRHVGYRLALSLELLRQAHTLVAIDHPKGALQVLPHHDDAAAERVPFLHSLPALGDALLVHLSLELEPARVHLEDGRINLDE